MGEGALKRRNERGLLKPILPDEHSLPVYSEPSLQGHGCVITTHRIAANFY